MLGQVLDPPRRLIVPLVPELEAFQPFMSGLNVPLCLFGADDILDNDKAVLLELLDEGRVRVERRGGSVGLDDTRAIGRLDRLSGLTEGVGWSGLSGEHRGKR